MGHSILIRPRASRAAVPYQLDFVTPGSLPSSASVRKQMRQIWYLRIKALGRPHARHRLYARTLNFGGRLHFSIIDFLATVIS